MRVLRGFALRAMQALASLLQHQLDDRDGAAEQALVVALGAAAKCIQGGPDAQRAVL